MNLGPDDLGMQESSKRNESPSFTRFWGTLSIIIAPFFLIRYHYRSCSKDLQTQRKKEKRDLEEGKGKKKKKSIYRLLYITSHLAS